MEAVVRILWDGLFNARSSLGILSSELTAALTTRHAVYALPWPESEGALPPGVTRHCGETVDAAVRVCDPHSATLGLWRERAGRAKRSFSCEFVRFGIVIPKRTHVLERTLIAKC